MGFVRTQTVKLTWADGEFAGLEICTRRVSMEKLLELMPLMDADPDSGDTEALRSMFLEVGGRLVSWNLEDESGEPVPCTPETFLAQDVDLVKEVVSVWTAKVAGGSAEASPSEQEVGDLE